MLVQQLLVQGTILATQVLALHALNASTFGTEDVDDNDIRPKWLEEPAQKGLDLYDALKARGCEVADAVYPNSATILPPDLRFEFRPALFDATLKELLRIPLERPIVEDRWRSEVMGWVPPATGENAQLEPQERKGSAHFISTINVHLRIFIADEVTQGDLGEPWLFPQVAWYMWCRAIQKKVGRDDLRASIYYSQLKWFFFDDIRDEETIRLIRWAINPFGHPLGRKGWNSDNKSKDNPFWALLGSDTVSPLMQMLMDRKQDMNGKTVTHLELSISEVRNAKTGGLDRYMYTLWAEINEIPRSSSPFYRPLLYASQRQLFDEGSGGGAVHHSENKGVGEFYGLSLTTETLAIGRYLD